MKKRWVIVANTVVTKIYASNYKLTEPLKLIKEFYHPEGFKKDQDIMSDRPGHYQTSHTARGSYERSDAKEVGNDKFIHEVVNFLEKAKTSNQFDFLTLVAPPHLLGIFNKHVSKLLTGSIDKIIQKNLIKVEEHHLMESLTD